MATRVNNRNSQRVRSGPISPGAARKRDQLIVKIATEEFLAKGFANATMAGIASRSRISNTTLYGLFESKEALYSHISTASIANYRYDLHHALDVRRPFNEVILEVVQLMVNATDTKPANAILRLAIAERDRFPFIGKMMLDHTFALVTPLAVYLKAVAKKGAVSKAESLRLAYHLMGLACGGFGFLLVDPSFLYADRAEWVQCVVRLFTRGFPAAALKPAEK